MMYKRLKVTENTGLICHEPLIHSGAMTWRLRGENTVLTNCCRIKLTPKVANKVSRGLPLRN